MLSFFLGATLTLFGSGVPWPANAWCLRTGFATTPYPSTKALENL